jgi:hypothetical protein
MAGQTKKGNGGNPKKRKGGGSGGNTRSVSGEKSGKNTPVAATAAAAPPPPQIDIMGKAKEIIIKWAFVCFSAWVYIQLKKYRQKQKEDNPFTDS